MLCNIYLPNITSAVAYKLGVSLVRVRAHVGTIRTLRFRQDRTPPSLQSEHIIMCARAILADTRAVVSRIGVYRWIMDHGWCGRVRRRHELSKMMESSIILVSLSVHSCLRDCIAHGRNR